MFGVTEVVPSLILLTGVVDDLRSRKVHNALVVGLFGAALLGQITYFGLEGVKQGGLGVAAALVSCIPLVLARVIGAGDMKLMVAFGMATTWPAVLTVVLWSLVWGAVLGLTRAIVAGDFSRLLTSTYLLTTKAKPSESSLHKIPYTIALLFGWMSYLILARTGGGWL